VSFSFSLVTLIGSFLGILRFSAFFLSSLSLTFDQYRQAFRLFIFSPPPLCAISWNAFYKDNRCPSSPPPLFLPPQNRILFFSGVSFSSSNAVLCAVIGRMVSMPSLFFLLFCSPEEILRRLRKALDLLFHGRSRLPSTSFTEFCVRSHDEVRSLRFQDISLDTRPQQNYSAFLAAGDAGEVVTPYLPLMNGLFDPRPGFSLSRSFSEPPVREKLPFALLWHIFLSLLTPFGFSLPRARAFRLLIE